MPLDRDKYIDDRPQRNALLDFDVMLTFSCLPADYQRLIEAIPMDSWLKLPDKSVDALLRGTCTPDELKHTLFQCGLTQARIKEILHNGKPHEQLN